MSNLWKEVEMTKVSWVGGGHTGSRVAPWRLGDREAIWLPRGATVACGRVSRHLACPQLGLGRMADGGNKRRCRQMVVIAATDLIAHHCH